MIYQKNYNQNRFDLLIIDILLDIIKENSELKLEWGSLSYR